MLKKFINNVFNVDINNIMTAIIKAYMKKSRRAYYIKSSIYRVLELSFIDLFMKFYLSIIKFSC